MGLEMKEPGQWLLPWSPPSSTSPMGGLGTKGAGRCFQMKQGKLRTDILAGDEVGWWWKLGVWEFQPKCCAEIPHICASSEIFWFRTSHFCEGGGRV